MPIKNGFCCQINWKIPSTKLKKKQHFFLISTAGLKISRNKLKKRRKFEQKTKNQSSSWEWIEKQQDLLTASNFAKIYKREEKTQTCQKLSKIYITNHITFQYHRKKLHKKVEQFENIQRCGGYIDERLFYLEASPDGLRGNNLILKIKRLRIEFNAKKKPSTIEKYILEN